MEKDEQENRYEAWFYAHSHSFRFVSNCFGQPGKSSRQEVGRCHLPNVDTQRVSIVGWLGGEDESEHAISVDGRTWSSVVAANLIEDDSNGVKDIFLHDRDSGLTSRVSVSSSGEQATGDSERPSISADGLLVAFTSAADNLVEGDSGDYIDIFNHLPQSGETVRISVAPDGSEGNGDSYNPAVSTTGRYVVFESYANNLVAGDTNNVADIFVFDRDTGEMRRASLTSSGAQALTGDSWVASISSDGRLVAFMSEAYDLVANDTNLKFDVS
jgi:hypothetical protein